MEIAGARWESGTAMSGRVAAKPAHIERKISAENGVGSGDGTRYTEDRDTIEEPLVKYLLALSLYCGKV